MGQLASLTLGRKGRESERVGRGAEGCVGCQRMRVIKGQRDIRDKLRQTERERRANVKWKPQIAVPLPPAPCPYIPSSNCQIKLTTLMAKAGRQGGEGEGIDKVLWLNVPGNSKKCCLLFGITLRQTRAEIVREL